MAGLNSSGVAGEGGGGGEAEGLLGDKIEEKQKEENRNEPRKVHVHWSGIKDAAQWVAMEWDGNEVCLPTQWSKLPSTGQVWQGPEYRILQPREK